MCLVKKVHWQPKNYYHFKKSMKSKNKYAKMPLKLYAFFVFIIMTTSETQAQQYIEKNNALYLDTISQLPAGCKKEMSGYYYSLKAKYPKASETLVSYANDYLKSKNVELKNSGYITFRYVITCDGTPKYVELLEADASYKVTKHDPKLVLALYGFFKTLDRWRIVYDESGQPINYYSFISFKFENETITHCIP